jgi:hypothetical protein
MHQTIDAKMTTAKSTYERNEVGCHASTGAADCRVDGDATSNQVHSIRDSHGGSSIERKEAKPSKFPSVLKWIRNDIFTSPENKSS